MILSATIVLMARRRAEDKKEKRTIYLLKDDSSPQQVLELSSDSPDSQKYQSIELDDGIFYFGESALHSPPWVGSFFKKQLNDRVRTALLSKSTQGVYFTKVEIGTEVKTFALPFGYGHTMLNKSYCVDDFGLKLALNIVKKFRKTKRRNLTSAPKSTIEQLSKAGEISDFGFDVDQDLLEEITAKPEERYHDKFGKSAVTGKDSFTVSVNYDIYTIKSFLKTCYETYQKKDYKDKFPFIDHIKPITDTAEFDKILLDNLNGIAREGVRLWMAIPEIIAWEDIEGFSFSSAKIPRLTDDISLEDFKKSLKAEISKISDVKYLKNKRVRAFKNSMGEAYDSWSTWQCLYCEIEDKEELILLANGKWYKVSKDFVAVTQKKYKETLQESSVFVENPLPPALEGEHENDYNKRLAKSMANAILMDRKNIFHGGGASQIELCDVYDPDHKVFIHVKKYSGSSALSHLFSQGGVSGQLFLTDSDFREKVKEKEATFPINPSEEPKGEEYTIIFGIISKSGKELDLPFFSKVSFNITKQNLRGMRFRVYITKIDQLPNLEASEKNEKLTTASGLSLK